MERRDFIKMSSMVGMGALVLPSSLVQFDSIGKSKVKIGLIAVGLRGQSHLAELLKRNDVEIVAFADPDKVMMGMAQQIMRSAGKKEAHEYSNGPYDYKKLLKRDDIDAVIVSSPWEWHLEHAVESMKAGKIVGMEVCGAVTLNECWE